MSRSNRRVRRRVIMIGIGLALVVTGSPAAAQEPGSSAGDWEPVQKLDARQVDIDGSVVTRAGTAVVAWSIDNDSEFANRMYTSVRRPGDSQMSERQRLPGGLYTRCAPGTWHPVAECFELVTAGTDDVVLFAARESEYGAEEHVLSVQRLEGTQWVPLDDVAVPAPINQVRGAINDEGDYAVVWLDDPRTLGGAASEKGGTWAPLPALHLPPGVAEISHLQLRNDGGIAAVMHTVDPSGGRVSYTVATLVDGSWSIDRVRPAKSWLAGVPVAASAPTGELVLAWAERPVEQSNERLAVRVRPAGADKFGAKTRLSDDWPCGLDERGCGEFAVLDSGQIAGVWYDNWLRSEAYGSTYDAVADTWAPRTRLADGYVDAYFDIHPDGTVVMFDDQFVWTCHDVTNCTYVQSPDYFSDRKGHVYSQYRAGPDGSAFGLAYLERCGETACVYVNLRASALIPL